MNIKKIREAINLPIPEDHISSLILQIIAEDKKVIPMVMEILSYERERNRELITDMNLELSRADICLENSKLFEGGKDWVRGEISKFYNKFNEQVHHYFKPKKDEQ